MAAPEPPAEPPAEPSAESPAGPAAARVLLLSDPESIVPVRRTRDGLPAIAIGRGDGAVDIRSVNATDVRFAAGDVFVTVEHLEQAAARAEAHGQTRAAFDARQSLHDYLPSTVEAWKAQDSADRRAEELAQALAEVRAIADSEDARAAQRRAWETQQRFLRSRSPDAALPEPDPERRG